MHSNDVEMGSFNQLGEVSDVVELQATTELVHLPPSSPAASPAMVICAHHSVENAPAVDV